MFVLWWFLGNEFSLLEVKFLVPVLFSHWNSNTSSHGKRSRSTNCVFRYQGSWHTKLRPQDTDFLDLWCDFSPCTVHFAVRKMEMRYFWALPVLSGDGCPPTSWGWVSWPGGAAGWWWVLLTLAHMPVLFPRMLFCPELCRGSSNKYLSMLLCSLKDYGIASCLRNARLKQFIIITWCSFLCVEDGIAALDSHGDPGPDIYFATILSVFFWVL